MTFGFAFDFAAVHVSGLVKVTVGFMKIVFTLIADIANLPMFAGYETAFRAVEVGVGLNMRPIALWV